MKLVGYIRVSSKIQAENTSLNEQRRRIQAYCGDVFQHELIQVFEEVGSGKNAGDRPNPCTISINPISPRCFTLVR